LITVHYAQSLDGRLATRSGDSQWIGGPESLKLAHQLRAEHAAVLVGVGTVLADNPRLTVRLVEGPSPCRVVVDSTLRLPLDAHLLNDGAAPTVVATTERALPDRIAAIEASGARVLLVPADPFGRVNLTALLEQLDVTVRAERLLELLDAITLTPAAIAAADHKFPPDFSAN